MIYTLRVVNDDIYAACMYTYIIINIHQSHLLLAVHRSSWRCASWIYVWINTYVYILHAQSRMIDIHQSCLRLAVHRSSERCASSMMIYILHAQLTTIDIHQSHLLLAVHRSSWRCASWIMIYILHTQLTMMYASRSFIIDDTPYVLISVIIDDTQELLAARAVNVCIRVRYCQLHGPCICHHWLHAHVYTQRHANTHVSLCMSMCVYMCVQSMTIHTWHMRFIIICVCQYTVVRGGAHSHL